MSTQEFERLSGWRALGVVVMFSVGFLRIISGVSYLADSRKVNDLTLGLFGDNLWAWGLWDLGIAIVALFAGYSLLVNGTFGKVVAYLWAVLVIVNSFLIMGPAPWFAAAMIALAVLVVYGVAKSSEEASRAPAA
ncbi:MAG TPA: hypothetical protein VFR38_14975 [Gaiellaceae bacterium]|nr:hypothetical protein [Gaiellaceae bacterium]